MKSKFITILAAMFIFMNFSAEAHRIVDITKRGGILGLYDYVHQEYQGSDWEGNTYWKLTCYQPGWAGCRLNPSGIIVTEDPSHTDGATAEINCANSAIDWVDNEIETNAVESGSVTKHYLVELPNSTVVDVYVELTWAPITGTSDYSITATAYTL